MASNPSPPHQGEHKTEPRATAGIVEITFGLSQTAKSKTKIKRVSHLFHCRAQQLGERKVENSLTIMQKTGKTGLRRDGLRKIIFEFELLCRSLFEEILFYSTEKEGSDELKMSSLVYLVDVLVRFGGFPLTCLLWCKTVIQ